jgi:hypothetical protein
MGKTRIPEAHPVSIQLANPNRSLPPNASFAIFHAPALSGPGSDVNKVTKMRLLNVSINDSGYAIFNATGEAQIELAGRVRMGVYTPSTVGLDWVVGPRVTNVTGDRKKIIIGKNKRQT